MQNFISGSTIKEVAVFAGAYAALQGMCYIKSKHTDSCFRPYPLTVKHGFVSVLQPLRHIMAMARFQAMLSSLEDIIGMCEDGNVRANGFETNRLATRWVQEVESLIASARSHQDTTTAMNAITYEKDSLPILKSMVDDLQRNMLLDYLSF